MMFMLIVHPVLSHVLLLQVIAPSKVPSTGFLSTRKMQILMKCLWYDDILFFNLSLQFVPFVTLMVLFDPYLKSSMFLIHCQLLLCFHQDVLHRSCFANLFHYSSYVIFLKSLQAASLIQVDLSGLMLHCVAKICLHAQLRILAFKCFIKLAHQVSFVPSSFHQLFLVGH